MKLNHLPDVHALAATTAAAVDGDRRARLLALAGELRPELHRYCARLMGSVIDGEDVVQDTFVRAFLALDELDEAPPLRPWLFRIAHNRALDLLRSRAIRAAEPIEAAHDVTDQTTPDPVVMLMRQEAVKTAVSRFTELPILQRSVVIMKDVLDEPLAEIGALLDLTVDAVKGHLARDERGFGRSMRAMTGFPTRGRRPPRWRAMWRSSTGRTGTGCARCWPTTSSSTRPHIRFGSAAQTSECFSASTPRWMACGLPQPGSMTGR
jgi:RNA polymerase sigma factor (sigma-70 family)